MLQKLRAPTGAIRRIHVSRMGDFGRVRLDAADHGRESFGQVVVARDFGEALEARLSELRGLTRYRPARFIGFADGDEGVSAMARASCASPMRMANARCPRGWWSPPTAPAAACAQRWAIGADEHDYGQTLFVARVRAERSPDGIAYERFGDDGPTALLPRGDRHYGVVHGVAREAADAVAALDEAAWLARLQQAFGWRVGRFLASGPRSAYPVDAGGRAAHHSRRARCWSAMPRRPCIRSARRVSTSACAMR